MNWIIPLVPHVGRSLDDDDILGAITGILRVDEAHLNEQDSGDRGKRDRYRCLHGDDGIPNYHTGHVGVLGSATKHALRVDSRGERRTDDSEDDAGKHSR